MGRMRLVLLALGVVVGCGGPKSSVPESPPRAVPAPPPPPSTPTPVAPTTLDNADRSEHGRGQGKIFDARFLGDGTLAVQYSDEVQLVGADGATLGRVPIDSGAWAVSRTVASPEIVAYNATGKTPALVFYGPNGKETGRVDLGPAVVKNPKIEQASAKRVVFRAENKTSIIDRATSKTMATLERSPSSVDEDATRAVVDKGLGSLEVIELDGSGKTTQLKYKLTNDAASAQTARQVSIAPDGRSLAVLDVKGVSLFDLPSAARTEFAGADIVRTPWGRDGKLALEQRNALVLVDRTDPKKVERFPLACPTTKKSCKLELWAWRDVRWTSPGPVIGLTEDEDIFVWRVGEQVRAFVRGGQGSAVISLSPDGRYVLDFRSEGNMHLLRVDAAAPWSIVLREKADRASFSPDGKRLVFWTEKIFKLYEVETQKKIESGRNP